MRRRTLKIVSVFVIGLCALFLAQRGAERTLDGAHSDVGGTGLFDGAAVVKRFSDDFSSGSALEEAGDMDESGDPNWWVSSGAYLNRADGVGRTVLGQLEAESKWQAAYRKNDPGETDDGFHPQNIFRLVTRGRWRNYTQQVYYRILEYRLSEDSHRSASNGLLLFNRYRDENNIYYAGIRVDGTAVIKKKLGGTYYTMASKRILPGGYDRETEPNLLPTGTWIGLRSEVKDGADGKVGIRLYIDWQRSGRWEPVLETEDDGKSFGGEALSGEAYAGIRTDFMDVEFDDYEIVERGEQ